MSPVDQVDLGRVGRWLGVALAAAVCVTFPIGVRVVSEGRDELVAARLSAEVGDFDREIAHLGRAARWRMPGFSHDEDALARLLEHGRARDALGEDGARDALLVYREIRGALIATRVFAVSDPELLAEANRAIARLMADQERRFGTDLSGVGDPETHHLQLLERPVGPDPLRANLAALAFLIWLVATAGFVTRALGPRGQLRRRPALIWGLASLAALIAWAVLLRFAS